MNKTHSLSLPRRHFLKAAGGGLAGLSASNWLPAFAEAIADHPDRRRHCILLWMAGGPSQTDTFDMKPDHENGGEFREIETSVPGLRFSEHLPLLAKHAQHLAIVRGLSTREGDHARGTHMMRTGNPPGGPVQYPSIGSSLSKLLVAEKNDLPDYVSIGAVPPFSPAAFGPGFLGPKYAPTTVGTRASDDGDEAEEFAQLGVDNLHTADDVTAEQLQRRRVFWQTLQHGFLDRHTAGNAVAHNTVYRRAMQMTDGNAAEAFDMSRESNGVREKYGRGAFGQGCLMARRLIERGVPFVEVALGGDSGVGWDTHQDNFGLVRDLSQQLDAGWASLMSELSERGLLDTTTILWMGEFGRTPVINDNAGRDHFPQAWTCVFAGGGVQGGQVYGKTSRDGMEVVDGKVTAGDVLATLCAALGVDPATENYTNQGRPVRVAEGTAIKAILA